MTKVRSGMSVVLGVLVLATSSVASRGKSSSEVTQAEAGRSSSLSSLNFGLGVSGSGASAGGLSPEASLWVEFNDKNALQVLFGIQSTAPFTFSAGALYKHSLIGTWNQGFHLGGGALLGTRASGLAGSTFAATITGLAGLHFQVPGVDHILIQADIGPAIDIVGGAADFRIGAVGGLLGLSIHYLF